MQTYNNRTLFRCRRAIIIALILCCAIVSYFKISGSASAVEPAGPYDDNTKLAEDTWKIASQMNPGAAPDSTVGAADPLLTDIDQSLIIWEKLSDGLELLELGLVKSGNSTLRAALPQARPADLTILRIDPEFYEFTLHMASEDAVRRSLAEHGKTHNLVAVINAGMYLPDNVTNTGYMRNSTHTNNPRIVSRFGVFFVAEPVGNTSLPKAALLEKSALEQDAETILNKYKIVVQNFRLISTDGKILWKESQTAHSISALAQGANGNMLMVLCRFQLSPADFSRLLLALPLECSSAMYLEGGSHSGMFLKKPDLPEPVVIRGKSGSVLAIDAPSESALPNVLGIRPRHADTGKSSD